MDELRSKKKKLARGFDIKLFSQMCFSFMEWIRWSTWKNCVGSKRIFVNSLRYLLQRVVINVKFIKRWPRWNPSNYRAIKLTIASKFFTNLEIQNSIDLKYLRYLLKYAVIYTINLSSRSIVNYPTFRPIEHTNARFVFTIQLTSRPVIELTTLRLGYALNVSPRQARG